VRDSGPDAGSKTEFFQFSFTEELKRRGFADKVQVVRALDIGVYDEGAVVQLLPSGVTYANVLQLAHQVQDFCQLQAQLVDTTPAAPLLVVTDADLGKALGNELHLAMPNRPLAVIDEVHTDEGDYLDIGQSIFNGQVVPLTVKSLAFPV